MHTGVRMSVGEVLFQDYHPVNATEKEAPQHTATRLHARVHQIQRPTLQEKQFSNMNQTSEKA